MQLTIVEDSPSHLAEYARVSIGLTVSEAFDDEGIAALARGASATPIAIATPYWKDYDSYPGGSPTDWPAKFDMSHWTILAAFLGEQRVGGAVLVAEDPQIDLLRDCADCALLWDLRVAPDVRARAIGSTLLRAAEEQARQRGAHALRVETQQVNVPACCFYQRHGFRLEGATRGVYGDLPGEVQLLWRKTLVAEPR